MQKSIEIYNFEVKMKFLHVLIFAPLELKDSYASNINVFDILKIQKIYNN
jgi:hypothetical protein